MAASMSSQRHRLKRRRERKMEKKKNVVEDRCLFVPRGNKNAAILSGR